MPEIVVINERIQYLPGTRNPLSADVFAVRGGEAWWIFDVGRSDDALAFINGLPTGNGFPEKKNIVVSHFHGDHTENLVRARQGEVRLAFDALYLGNYAQRRLKMGEAVMAPLEFDDIVRIRIFPIPNSHARGSLAMTVDADFAFLGDATYAEVGYESPDSYNVQFLQEEIRVLKEQDTPCFCLSHRRRPMTEKGSVIAHLESVYSRRQSGESRIFV